MFVFQKLIVLFHYRPTKNHKILRFAQNDRYYREFDHSLGWLADMPPTNPNPLMFQQRFYNGCSKNRLSGISSFCKVFKIENVFGTAVCFFPADAVVKLIRKPTIYDASVRKTYLITTRKNNKYIIQCTFFAFPVKTFSKV